MFNPPQASRFVVAIAIATAMCSAAKATGASGPFEDIAALDARVTLYTGVAAGDPGGAVAPIDRRLRLTKCPSEPTIEPTGLGILAVRCAALRWRLGIRLMPLSSTNAADNAPLAPIVIRKGDAIQLSYAGAGFSLSTEAVAMDSAPAGHPIRVQLPGQRTAISAIAVRSGFAKIAINH
jgi:flagella basal body P-ring formation protein FlgA